MRQCFNPNMALYASSLWKSPLSVKNQPRFCRSKKIIVNKRMQMEVRRDQEQSWRHCLGSTNPSRLPRSIFDCSTLNSIFEILDTVRIIYRPNCRPEACYHNFYSASCIGSSLLSSSFINPLQYSSPDGRSWTVTGARGRRQQLQAKLNISLRHVEQWLVCYIIDVISGWTILVIALKAFTWCVPYQLLKQGSEEDVHFTVNVIQWLWNWWQQRLTQLEFIWHFKFL